MNREYTFTLSAPGTVFLIGDPLRRNKTFVAASLDIRTTIRFTSMPLPASPDYVDIYFSNLKLRITIPLNQLFTHFSETGTNLNISHAWMWEKTQDFINSFKYFGSYESANRAHRLSLQAFFFLFVLITYTERLEILSPFFVELWSELPMGEGLGSSASFAVCLAACFYRWSLVRKGIDRHDFTYEELVTIWKYAQRCDDFVFNSKTEISTMVSTFGTMVSYEDEKLIKMTLSDLGVLKILLVFSGITRHEIFNTLSMERKVIHFSTWLVRSILDSIENISTAFRRTLKELDTKLYYIKRAQTHDNHSSQSDLRRSYKTLHDLVHMHQGLQRALGMSHPNLDIICAIARSFKFAAKFTGQGGGGYAFILATSYLEPRGLLEELKSRDFSVTIAYLNCKGIKLEATS